MQPEIFAAVAWECVHFTDAVDTAQIEQALPTYFVGTVQSHSLEGKDDFLTRLAEAFRFPNCFGANWDAVQDFLRDLDWIAAQGYILIVRGARELWRDTPQLGGSLISVWMSVAGEWANIGTPFHLVFEW